MVQAVNVSVFEQEVLNSNVPVVVDFWSPGCGPCRLQDPVLAQLADEAQGQFEVRKVNAWDEPDLAVQYNVNAVPTLLVFNHGQVVRRMVGFHDRAKVLKAIQETV